MLPRPILYITHNSYKSYQSRREYGFYFPLTTFHAVQNQAAHFLSTPLNFIVIPSMLSRDEIVHLVDSCKTHKS